LGVSVNHYFASEALLTASVPMNVSGQSVQVLGVQIPVGGHAVAPLALYADGTTTGQWTVTADDAVHLADGWRLTNGQDTFVVESTLGSQMTLWMGEVTN
jgi:hypothetical protein